MGAEQAERPQMNEITYSPEELKDLEAKIRLHATTHRVPADNSVSKCVDGGYKPDEAEGALARAGGDLGVAMLLLGQGFSAQEAFDKVLSFCKANGRRFGWHTDKHEGHHGVVVGCGHCNAAIQAGEKYGVDGSKVNELLTIIKQAQETDPENVECVTLDREHSEKAILAVTSKNHTVRPWDGVSGEQYFIYDKTRDDALLQEFAEYSGIDLEELMKVAGVQLNATLGLLASSKGKPIFTVNVDEEGKVEVQHAGFAPTSA